MSRVRPALPLALLALLLVAGRAEALIGGADPRELVPTRGFGALRLAGKVKTIAWQGHARATSPRPVDLPLADLRVAPPPGAWTDLVLTLDGPLLIEGTTDQGDPVRLQLALDTLVIPLDDPDADAVTLELSLPGWLSAAAEGGLDLAPGHPLHDALAAALADGALAVPAR